MNSRGQAVLESLFTFPLLITAFIFVTTLSYYAFASAWIGYQMDQSLFCLAEGRTEYQCTTLLRSRLRILPFGQVVNLKIEEAKRDNWRGQVEFVWMKQKILRKKILRWDSYTLRS